MGNVGPVTRAWAWLALALAWAAAGLSSEQHRHSHGHRRPPSKFRPRHDLALGEACNWDYGVEFSLGVQDLGNASSPEPGGCCAACTAAKGCTHWQWKHRICWLKTGLRHLATRTECVAPEARAVSLVDDPGGKACAAGVAAPPASAATTTATAAALRRSHDVRGGSSIDVPRDYGGTGGDGPPHRLFCFVVVRPTPADAHLARLLRPLLAMCDAHAVFSNVTAAALAGLLVGSGSTSDSSSSAFSAAVATHAKALTGGDGEAVVQGSMDVPLGPAFNALNSRVFQAPFLAAFQRVVRGGFDWAVKVGAKG